MMGTVPVTTREILMFSLLDARERLRLYVAPTLLSESERIAFDSALSIAIEIMNTRVRQEVRLLKIEEHELMQRYEIARRLCQGYVRITGD